MKTLNRSFPFRSFLFVVLLLTAAASAQNQKAQDLPKYRNPNLSIEDRVADLLQRMTLEEKVAEISGGEMIEILDPTGTFTTQQAREILSQRMVRSPISPSRANSRAILRNGVQRYQGEKTRLGIPNLFMGEACTA